MGALELLCHLGYGVPAAAVALLLLRLGAPYGRGLGPLCAAAACLAAGHSLGLAQVHRAALLEELGRDYVTTARAKGAGPARAYAHALANALIPLVTLLSLDLPALLSGSVLVEAVFGVPGLGLLGFDAVLTRDYPVLLGLTSLGALVTLLCLLFGDLLSAAIDPRLRPRLWGTSDSPGISP